MENFGTMNPRGGSYLMIRELKGVESMSSRRLLIEPGGARCEGSLPTHATGGRAACPCRVGKLEGLECASSDMVVWGLFLQGVWGPRRARLASDIWGLFWRCLLDETRVEPELSSRRRW